MTREAAPGPARASTRWTAPGATVGVVALGALLGAFFVGPPAILFSAVLLSLLVVARAEASRHLPPLTADVTLPARVPWGEAFHARVDLRPREGTRASRDVVAALGLREQAPRPVAYVPWLSAGVVRTIRPAIRSFERGRCRAWTVAAETTYPFGLFRRRLVESGTCDLLVLPRTGRIRGFETLLVRSTRRRSRTAPTAGEEDLKALREWRPGESRRRIHWKASARRGTTILRELEEPTESPIHLLFDERVDRGGRRRTAAFERAVRLAASLVESFRRTRREFAFTVLGADGATPVPSRGTRRSRLALEVLAEVQPAEQDATTPLPVPDRRRRARLVLVCAGKPPAERRVAEAPDLVLDVTSEETLAWLRDTCGWAEE